MILEGAKKRDYLVNHPMVKQSLMQLKKCKNPVVDFNLPVKRYGMGHNANSANTKF